MAEGNGKTEGIVEWFSPIKGFGFISRDEGEDVFVHFTEIICAKCGTKHEADGCKKARNLEAMQKVSFALGEREGKPIAVDVKVAG